MSLRALRPLAETGSTSLSGWIGLCWANNLLAESFNDTCGKSQGWVSRWKRGEETWLLFVSSFSSYHPNIICNSRRQLVKHQTDILPSFQILYNNLLSFQTLYIIISMFGQAILDKYEASNCQQLFNLLHWNVMTDQKNDNIAQLFYSLPLSVLNFC